MRAGAALRALYRQGQRPEPRTREYFYYIDHRGQLFLDDAKVKNFVTCFKDPSFLRSFLSLLQPNRSGRYESQFPFLSRCGRERNFLRCEDRPVVFQELLPGIPGGKGPSLSYGPGLSVPFQPEQLVLFPGNGRLYHPAPRNAGGVGLVRSELAARWIREFPGMLEGISGNEEGHGKREMLRLVREGMVGKEKGVEGGDRGGLSGNC